MRAKQAPATSTTIPAPSTAVPLDLGAKSHIPHDILPVLGVLRKHISELRRDNHALRYTFGLSTAHDPPLPTASSSKVTLDRPEAEAADYKGKKTETVGVDLEAVMRRVKELVRENEELGDMVVEVGKASAEEWQAALEGALFPPALSLVEPHR